MRRLFSLFLILFIQQQAYAALSFQNDHTVPLETSLQSSSTTNVESQPESQLQQKEYSELAFASGANTSKEDNPSNIRLNQEKNFGAILNNEQKPFGYNLFESKCQNLSHLRFFNPEYRISIGDKINIQIWGAFKFSKVMTVDTQGNIFLPEVGPVRLKGIQNKDLNLTLGRELKKIFLKDVHVYGDLVTATPVQVYVTGFVTTPGLYDGLSSDSIIYYLCKAGGINNKEGSFRNIKILRSGKVIHKIDLYRFITHGQIDHFQLHQGDTILVGALQQTASVAGNVKSPYFFEFRRPQMSMTEVMQYAHLDPSVTHVRIERHQGQKPKVNYLPLSRAKNMKIEPGDHLVFVSDQSQHQVVVTVTGEVIGAHQFVLKKGENLDSLLHKLNISREADVRNIQLYRESVAEQQKTAVESSLARLERQVLMSSSVTADGAKLQVLQSQMISKFIDKAKNVKFQGQVILGPQPQWKNIHLVNNDVVNVPRKTSIITVSGDVLTSVSVEAEPGKSVRNYIEDAGGFAPSADKNKILLVHQSGRVEVLSPGIFGKQRQVVGGDQIIVLSKPQSESWQVAEALTQVMYRIAIAARVAVLI